VNHSLQPTALVNELFLHLARQKEASVQDRAHFLALASQVMKRLLIDYARAHNSEKRNSGEILLNLEDSMCPHTESAYHLVEIGDLLERMSQEEPRMARVFEMRCFGGLTHLEIAGVLDLTERTVKRDWRVARAWFVANIRRETK
jgi:RNA polymerase sigma-70 factor (ECF subfamily)